MGSSILRFELWGITQAPRFGGSSCACLGISVLAIERVVIAPASREVLLPDIVVEVNKSGALETLRLVALDVDAAGRAARVELWVFRRPELAFTRDRVGMGDRLAIEVPVIRANGRGRNDLSWTQLVQTLGAARKVSARDEVQLARKDSELIEWLTKAEP